MLRNTFESNQHAFSLVELMIVIAVVAILAAISIPAYRNYIVRSYITEAIALGDSMRTQIEEIYSSTGQLPCCSTGQFADCDCSQWSPAPTFKGPKDVIGPTLRVSLMRWFSRGDTPAGRIELFFSTNTPAEITNVPLISGAVSIPFGARGIVLMASPSSSARGSSLQWSCGPYGNNASMIPYLPGTCRTASTW